MSSTDKGIRGYERLVCPNGHELYVPLDYDYMGVECSLCGELATLVQADDAETAETYTTDSQREGSP